MTDLHRDMDSTSLDKNRSVSVLKEPSLSLSRYVPANIEASGETRAKRDNEYTDRKSPSKVTICAPVQTFHNIASTLDLEASRELSGENDKDVTESE